MITAIEEAVLDRITSRITALKTGANQKDTKQLLTSHAVAVAVLEGTFERVTDSCWRQDITVSVLVKFKNMTSEEARRKGINPLCKGIVLLLAGQKLDLDIKALQPKRFRDVTTEEKYNGGVIEYLIEFTTAFFIKKQEEDEVNDLITMSLAYMLKPGDDTADASDTLTTTV